MKLAEVERELLDRAIQTFHIETGLLLEVIQEQVVLEGYEVDAIIKMPQHGVELAVEVKRWAQQANLGALAAQIKRLPMEGLLVADYINPNMAQRLKTMGVQFIDAAGNAYLNQPPVYVHVTGNKKPDTQVAFKEGVNRAFDATGLKVVYGFLCDPELVDATYRVIAERTGVALGTIGRVLNGLTEAGFIVGRGRGKGRRLVKKRRLFDRWVEAYPEKLKPKQRVGDFVADDPYWWEKVNAEEYGAYWGGEIAAEKYTKYLKPQTATLYLPEYTGKKLLARARLRKLREGEVGGQGVVKIYRPFWPVEDEGRHYNNKMAEIPGVVNPILVYADLIATGDSRNLETARMIYERYIAEHIGED
jgi:hypothetical protein